MAYQKVLYHEEPELLIFNTTMAKEASSSDS